MMSPAGDSPPHAHGRVYAGLVLTMVFWGSAFATSKMLVLEVPPEVGAALRFGFGSLLMMAILFRRAAKPIPARAAWGRLAVVSLVGVTGFSPVGLLRLAPRLPGRDGGCSPNVCPAFTAMAGML